MKKRLINSSVHLSSTAGRVLVGCIATILENEGGVDEITKKLLVAVRDHVIISMGLGADNKNPKPIVTYALGTLSYSLVSGAVTLSMELDPESPENEFREALQKMLRRMFTPTQPTEEAAAASAPQGLGAGNTP